MPERILVADNEKTISSFLKKILEYDKSIEVEVDIANDIAVFNKLLSGPEYSAIIIDLSFGGKNVNDFIAKYSTQSPHIPIIALSASIDLNVALTTIRNGAYDFLTKPFTAETILLVVKNAIEKRQLLMEKENLSRDLQMINDQLTSANEAVSRQKEQIDGYLHTILEGIEKISTLSGEISQVKSFETNLSSIFEKFNSNYSPHASVLMVYNDKNRKFVVKKEMNYTESFSVGTQLDAPVFKKYFNSDGVAVNDELTKDPDRTTVIIPLETGKMILGLILADIDTAFYNQSGKPFFEILRYVITVSILNSKFLEDSRRSYLESLLAFLLLQETVHKGIKKHSELVSTVCVNLGKNMNLPENELRNLQYAALLHLLGLTVLPKEMLTKEYYFAPDSQKTIKQSILNGCQILTPLVFLDSAKTIIEQIFENYDGTGAPEGIQGAEIPLTSRILRAAGEYYAFRNIFHMQMEESKQYLNDNLGTLYDPEVVKLLFEVIKKN